MYSVFRFFLANRKWHDFTSISAPSLLKIYTHIVHMFSNSLPALVLHFIPTLMEKNIKTEKGLFPDPRYVKRGQMTRFSQPLPLLFRFFVSARSIYNQHRVSNWKASCEKNPFDADFPFSHGEKNVVKSRTKTAATVISYSAEKNLLDARAISPLLSKIDRIRWQRGRTSKLSLSPRPDMRLTSFVPFLRSD